MIPSVKIGIMGGKVCLRCKGKTLLGVVNKLLKTKSLLTSPSMVCLIPSSKLSRQWFEFSLKLKVIGSNPAYLLRFFLLYLKYEAPSLQLFFKYLFSNVYFQIFILKYLFFKYIFSNTVKSRALTRVTIQKIKALGVLLLETCHYSRHVTIQKFKNSKILKSRLSSNMGTILFQIGFFHGMYTMFLGGKHEQKNCQSF